MTNDVYLMIDEYKPSIYLRIGYSSISSLSKKAIDWVCLKIPQFLYGMTVQPVSNNNDKPVKLMHEVCREACRRHFSSYCSIFIIVVLVDVQFKPSSHFCCKHPGQIPTATCAPICAPKMLHSAKKWEANLRMQHNSTHWLCNSSPTLLCLCSIWRSDWIIRYLVMSGRQTFPTCWIWSKTVSSQRMVDWQGQKSNVCVCVSVLTFQTDQTEEAVKQFCAVQEKDKIQENF